MFLTFFVYPFASAPWMASKPSLYADLIADRLYLPTIVNALLFVGVGVNVKLFLALLLSGFFLRPRWWLSALLGVVQLLERGPDHGIVTSARRVAFNV